jgi:hypothetical protein
MTLDNLPEDTTKIFSQRDVRETAGIVGSPTIGDFTTAQHNHSDAAGGGTIDHLNVTSIGTNSHSQIDTHIANTANPHSVVLSDLATAGEGIDFSGSTIQGENCSDTNKGIAVFPSDDFTVSAGSVALKAAVCMSIDGDSGTATPAVHNIDILGGTGITTAASGNDVTITTDDANIDHDSLNNTHNMTTDIDARITAGDGIDYAAGTISCEDSTAGNKGIVIVSPGEGMNVSYAAGTATISGEDATDGGNKGIASFNPDDFAVAAGAVSLDDDVVSTIDGDAGTATGSSHNIDILGTANEITTTGAGNDITIALANKTSYWSFSFASINSNTPDVDDVNLSGNGYTLGGSYILQIPVYLPQGAVVTDCVVYGNVGTEDDTWTLKRQSLSTTTQSDMASAAFNTEDSTISNATVDNSTYSYIISSTILIATDEVYGGRITYTTDYD